MASRPSHCPLLHRAAVVAVAAALLATVACSGSSKPGGAATSTTATTSSTQGTAASGTSTTTTSAAVTTTTSPSSTSSTSTAPPTTQGQNNVAAADNKVTSLGVSPEVHVGFDDPTGLAAVTGPPTGAASGRAGQVFFFHAGTYLGTDASSPSISIADVSRTDANTITVTYHLYSDSDPLCCPTGGVAKVRFHWNGAKVVALDPIPPTEGTTHR